MGNGQEQTQATPQQCKRLLLVRFTILPLTCLIRLVLTLFYKPLLFVQIPCKEHHR